MPAKRKMVPKKKMKVLHWKPIRANQIPGTMWEDISKMEDDLVKEYFTEDFKSDMEAKFAEKERKRKKAAKKKAADGGDGGGGGESKKKEEKILVEIIDGKRSYNVMIGLSRFKMQNETIKECILKMDEELLNVDKIEKLIKVKCLYMTTQ